MTATSAPTSRHVPRRVLCLTAGAVLCYGGVAALANHVHGDAAMFRAALVQGASSGITTFGLSTLIERGLALLRRRGVGRRTSAAVVGPAAASLGATLHVAVNAWAGTPGLLATVALPIVALAIYCPLYVAAALRAMPPLPGPR